MTITASDLLAPTGEIEGAMFYPSLDSAGVLTRVGVYLAQGYEKVTAASIPDGPLADQVAANWAYYRAWSDVVRRITLKPASTSLAGEVSVSMLQSQINAWVLERDAWLAKFTALIPGTSTPATAGVSQSTPTELRF